jgi:4-alpha-methyl-delta7-sterol-4alpha-methyl oxidase
MTGMLTELRLLYGEPMFWLFPVATSVLSLVAFLLFALPMTWLAWRDPPGLRRYRVQARPMQVDKWLWPSLVRAFINTALMLLVTALNWPLLRLSGIHAGPLPPWYVMALQIVFFIYLDDILFYWMHRALHTRWLFRQVHSVHHRVRTPCAVAGLYFNWLEFIAISSLVIVGPLLVGAHVVTVWIWVVIRQLEAAEGHSGYDFPWSPLRILPGYDGNGYHDFHHGSFVGNYAGAFGYLDRIFGTRSPGYAEYVAKRHMRTASDS